MMIKPRHSSLKRILLRHVLHLSVESIQIHSSLNRGIESHVVSKFSILSRLPSQAFFLSYSSRVVYPVFFNFFPHVLLLLDVPFDHVVLELVYVIPFT